MSSVFNKVTAILFALLFSYQALYIIVSLLYKKKQEKAEIRYHNYAILICARNEQQVIGQLLESINNQSYPGEYRTAFVMADNCTDNTAETARYYGAEVYTRYNRQLIGKGYALEELLRHIERDYGDVFDGFLIIDADNILKQDYLEKMNESFCRGHKIITGYRNSKNFDSNWISAGYSLWFLRENRFLNKARYLLGLSCAVSGTGFLFSREILQHWNYHSLTEDLEFTVDQICAGNKIAYCEDAILYDEQPQQFMQSFHQRLRWAKGFIQIFQKYAGKLIRGIIKGDFSCFDMLNTIVSAYGLSMLTLFINLITLTRLIINRDSLHPFFRSLTISVIRAYLCLFTVGLLTTITEWKHIRTSAWNKIRYTFTFPLFMATYIPIAFWALFANVTWRPIRHTVTMSHESTV
ncbi:MAG: glycosyltransferase family 2 protein [Erysipelotrichaceae bacterium]|nr:glycosyltransferase family 2 protein [Erysipelotrichaceae bacterium]